MKPEFKKCCIFLALLAAAAVLIVLFIKWNEADGFYKIYGKKDNFIGIGEIKNQYLKRDVVI